jgi:hypothetical protein
MMQRSNGRFRILGHCSDHSGLIPAPLTTLPHFSVSSAMSLPKSARKHRAAEVSNARLILGSARPALISLLSLSMIAMGVFLGAPRPNQALAAAPAHKRDLRAVL